MEPLQKNIKFTKFKVTFYMDSIDSVIDLIEGKRDVDQFDYSVKGITDDEYEETMEKYF